MAKKRGFLAEVYNHREDPTVNLDELTDDEVINLCENLRAGVPMGTPVFDGAKESEIKKMLELSGAASSGQSWLYDGRTGEQFERPVTVGYMLASG